MYSQAFDTAKNKEMKRNNLTYITLKQSGFLSSTYQTASFNSNIHSIYSLTGIDVFYNGSTYIENVGHGVDHPYKGLFWKAQKISSRYFTHRQLITILPLLIISSIKQKLTIQLFKTTESTCNELTVLSCDLNKFRGLLVVRDAFNS